MSEPSASELARALASRPRHKQDRVCVVCGRTFQGTAKAKYCSRACAARAWRQAHRSAPDGSAAPPEGEQPS